MVRFKLHTRPKKEDGAAYEPAEYVEIDLAGDGKHVVSRPATGDDRAKYAAEYALFKPIPSQAAPPSAPKPGPMERALEKIRRK